jgi:hypothetical protein
MTEIGSEKLLFPSTEMLNAPGPSTESGGIGHATAVPLSRTPREKSLKSPGDPIPPKFFRGFARRAELQSRL